MRHDGLPRRGPAPRRRAGLLPALPLLLGLPPLGLPVHAVPGRAEQDDGHGDDDGGVGDVAAAGLGEHEAEEAVEHAGGDDGEAEPEVVGPPLGRNGGLLVPPVVYEADEGLDEDEADEEDAEELVAGAGGAGLRLVSFAASPLKRG